MHGVGKEVLLRGMQGVALALAVILAIVHALAVVVVRVVVIRQLILARPTLGRRRAATHACHGPLARCRRAACRGRVGAEAFAAVLLVGRRGDDDWHRLLLLPKRAWVARFRRRDGARHGHRRAVGCRDARHRCVLVHTRRRARPRGPEPPQDAAHALFRAVGKVRARCPVRLHRRQIV